MKLLYRWAFAFSALIGIALSLIATRFIEFMPELTTIESHFFLVTGMFSHFALLAIAGFFLFLSPLLLLVLFTNKVTKPIQYIAILVAASAILLLIADTFVYAQYRFHISGFVFDMLLQGGNDIIELSWITWLITTLVLIGSLLFTAYLSKLAMQLCVSNKWVTFKRIYISVLTLTFLTANSIHLYADATYNSSVTTLVRHVPMFSPLTGKKVLLNSGLVDASELKQKASQLSFKSDGSLNYPKATITSSKSDMNILMIIVDSLRYDMLAQDSMPNLNKFSQSKHVQLYQQHFSGGNSTRTGIFSLFYGLPGTYWSAFSTTQTEPVLMSTLNKQNYQMQILASAPLTQPAFDRSVFTSVNDLKIRRDEKTPWDRDRGLTDEWLKFIDTGRQNSKQPFFGVLFYDAVHGFSISDNKPKPFQPAWQRVEHLSLTPEFDPAPYFNLYKNAAYQVDQMIGEVLQQLSDKKMLDNTMVIFTSDHGQEFNDNGLNYWGHGSNFTEVQVKVPFFIHWPGRKAAEFSHRTSHADLSVSLMEDVFHTTNPISDYSLGYPLNNTDRKNWTIAGSYVNYAIIQPHQQTVTYNSGQYEILDNNGKLLPDAKLSNEVAFDVMAAMAEFYK